MNVAAGGHGGQANGGGEQGNPKSGSFGLVRAARLRKLCEDELGTELFEKVYGFLKRRSNEFWMADDEREAEMQNALQGIMGQEMLRFWPLVDQLIFCEEVEV